MATEKKNIVIVTGGTRGIGLAIVRTLREEGYDVVATGTKEGPFTLDLSSETSIVGFVEKILSTFGKGSLYGLVNNAGVCETCPIDNQIPGTYMGVWKRVMDVNLTGTARLTHDLCARDAFLPESRIVNIASQLGKIGRLGYSAYCASKFALIGFTQVLSRELAAGGTTVNAVCPGWVETEMLQNDLERMAKESGVTGKEYGENLMLNLEIGRFTRPEEIAYLVSFLFSKKAGAITGQAYSLNGPEM